MATIRLISVIAAILSFIPLVGNGQSHYVETTRSRLIFYSPEHAYITPHLIRCFENSLRFHQRLFDYTPSEKITILLDDFNDYGNAGASAIPWNYLLVGLEPYNYVYETGPTNERMNWVMNHEIAHLVAIDKPAAQDRFFRTLFFGKVPATSEEPLSLIYSYLSTPRWYSPRWYHEGIAVFFETWMAGGIGRVLGGYDEMVFRAMVNDSSYFYDFVGIESEGKTIDFQVGANSYLYGTRFVSYLAYQHGPEKLLEWFNRTENSRMYFGGQFKQVYGISLDEEWSRWTQFEHEWQRENLALIRLHPTTDYRPVVRKPLGSVSRAFYDKKRHRMYLAVSLPGQLANIVSIDIQTGAMEKICPVPSPGLYYVTSLAYDDSSESLYFTTHNSGFWRGINRVDLKTRRVESLLPASRIGDLVINPIDRSLWGVRHNNGYSSLVRIPAPYKSWEQVMTLLYGKDIFDLDISPDGLFMTASLIEVSGRQRLVRFSIDSLLQGNGRAEFLIDFENNTAPYNFVYSRDGKSVLGTSYYSGASNVYEYEFESRRIKALSNTETGFFRPVPMSVDSLIVFRYTGKGFLPVTIAHREYEDVSAVKYLGQEIVEQHPIVTTWMVGSPLSVDIDSVLVRQGDYKGLHHLRLAAAYPVIHGYKSTIALGEHVTIRDPGRDHSIDFTVSYSPGGGLPSKERIHFGINYATSYWKFSGAYNRTDFYDLFGPTKLSRKGYSLSANYTRYLVYDPPKSIRVMADLAGFGGLEKLPDAQNVATSFDRFLTGSIRVRGAEVHRSLGAVDEEDGVKWTANLLNTYVRTKSFPRLYGTLDYGFLLSIDHSSLWLRTAAGYAFGDQEDPFANFFFGGFGNNWVDRLDEKRYRDYYTFPGVKLNQIGGKDFAKLVVEWNLPPIRFRRLGFPVVYCNWSRFALFSSGLATNVVTRTDRRLAGNIGGQADFKLVIFSSLESTLSLGYATAVERDAQPSREFMASLKIHR